MRSSGQKSSALIVLSLAALAFAQQTPTPTPVQVQVSPTGAAIGVGAQKQFSASELLIGGLNRGGSTRSIGACVRWHSSNPNIASINLNSGLALGAGAGQTTVTASCGPFHGSAQLTVQTAACGDGIRQSGEQCDDSNTLNLDACNSSCAFEQDQRINSLTMQFSTDATCSTNALGGAITGTAQGSLQTLITNRVNDGSVTLLFAMLGITDLTGTNEASFKLGVLGGTHVAGSGYNGASDLDWWYTPDAAAIDANRVPLNQIDTVIAAHNLSAGPASITFPPILGGTNGLSISNATLKSVTGATSTPTASTGSTPGHLAAEHLDPALVSYASMNTGSVCGGISAASLAATPVPSALQMGGATACTQGYTSSNSMLDVFVGGCAFSFFQLINPTQPDTTDPGAPVAGAGGPYKLLTDKTTHQVNACTDKTTVTSVPLQACLAAAAYSSYFKFTTDRVIIK